MARSRFFREDFDRERNFVAKRQFVFGGKAFAPGQLIDKTAFTVRRLRQLYDQRFIEFGPDTIVEVDAAPTAPAVVPRRKFSPPTVKRDPVPRRRRQQVADGLPA
jgi:hypothetical protein